MRKITSEAKKAFEGGYNYKNTNTEVKKDLARNVSMYLFDNKIAHYSPAMGLAITSAGWKTATTKERLNALEGVNIIQRAGVWYLNGKEWAGDWIEIIEK